MHLLAMCMSHTPSSIPIDSGADDDKNNDVRQLGHGVGNWLVHPIASIMTLDGCRRTVRHPFNSTVLT